MSYLDHKKFTDAKNLDFVVMQAMQQASVSGFEKAIVSDYDGTYGKYYKILNYTEAKEANLEVIRHIRPLSPVKLSTDRKRRKSEEPDSNG